MGLIRAIAHCVLAIVVAGAVSPATSATPAEAPERTLFLQRYTRVAEFSLERGDISVWDQVDGPANNRLGVLVDFNGVLDHESVAVLTKLLERRTVGYLALNSPGGLVQPTLVLGKVARAKGVATIVEGGRECYSACALLFLAGNERVLGETVLLKGRLDRKQAVVGFHAPYIPQSDGTKRYLQDIKTSNVCRYLKSVMPAHAAAELCDYALATKGMATFNVEFGRELGVYTHDEAEILRDASGRAMAELDTQDQRWVACRRDTDRLLNANPSLSFTSEFRTKTWPCGIATGFFSPPKEPGRLGFLTRLATVMGPAELPALVRLAALESSAEKLKKMGLRPDDKQFIACQRAQLYIVCGQ